MFKQYVQRRLESYVRKYFRKHPNTTLIAVAGSVGKTSTKVAIGTVLSESFKVRMHEGNHNAEISTPLAILGIEYPKTLRSLKVWRDVFRLAQKRVDTPDDIDVIVQEVGTDRIGQVPHFGSYAKPDIAVVTSVAPEHMEYFKSLDAVAAEELSIGKFSHRTLLNQDDILPKYFDELNDHQTFTYGLTDASQYHFVTDGFSVAQGYKGKLNLAGKEIETALHVVGRHAIGPAVAASAVASMLGMSGGDIKKGLAKIHPVSGRMNVLKGRDGSMLIDDSYNSSPLAVAAALNTFYEIEAPQRIAVLGSMNELGDMTAAAHKALGKLCDPKKLDLVVTVGSDAAKYVAPVAINRGCVVHSFETSPEAGEFVKKHMKKNSAILFKGSQGGIYLEEAVKVVLASSDDAKKLVRQSPEWMRQKRAFFESVTL